MHPDIAALASLYFEELPVPEARSVTQHLSGCAPCRQEFERFRASVDGAVEGESSVAADCDRLLNRLREWETTTADSGLQGEALKRRIAEELAPYLGKAGADALLQPVDDDGGDLLTKVTPLLTMFLGRKAAGKLVSRVVEKTIVGTHTLCES
jgi:hypothetical protein